jgi:hypothetical protein
MARGLRLPLHRYEPRPVAIARGNEKGRVEQAIRYVRDAFFAARNFPDLDDHNAQADAWCNGPAADPVSLRCSGSDRTDPARSCDRPARRNSGSVAHSSVLITGPDAVPCLKCRWRGIWRA